MMNIIVSTNLIITGLFIEIRCIELLSYYCLFLREGKTFLGIQFMQNPNDAITIAELLHQGDIDLVIETGSHLGASALFFASILYQSRYDPKLNTPRPFKIVTMDISPAARQQIDKFPLLASYITFIPHGSLTPTAQAIVNETFHRMQPKNVFVSLDGDHYAETVYQELVHYHRYLTNIGNIIVAQDSRLSSKWHQLYCAMSKYDGPCNGPQEAVNWFLKNEGKDRFMIDSSKEYLFSTHHNGWLKKIA